jgi:hypothetical protein
VKATTATHRMKDMSGGFSGVRNWPSMTSLKANVRLTFTDCE